MLGTVLVEFFVNKNGSISDIKVVSKKHGDGVEEEAMRVVKNMPAWVPGKNQRSIEETLRLIKYPLENSKRGNMIFIATEVGLF